MTKNGKFEIKDLEIGLTYFNPITKLREDLSLVLDPTDVFYADKCNKPILGKMASLKFFEKFNITVVDVRINPSKDGVFAAVCMEMCPDERTILRFWGDGEASSANLESGISSKYPLALAVKRAKSRGIIEYFRIDAYSEVESPDFVGAPSKKQLDDIKKVAINRFLLDFLKQQIKDFGIEDESKFIKENLKSVKSGMQFSEVASISFLTEIVDLVKSKK